MSEYLNKFNKILFDLQYLDIEILDNDNTLLFLNSLPDLYEYLTTVLHKKHKIRFEECV